MFPDHLIFPLLAGSSEVRAYIESDNGIIRAYPHGRAPDGAAYPYVTWQTSDGVPLNSLSDLPPADSILLQVDCWSTNDGQGLAQLRGFVQAIRDALESTYNMLSYSSDGPDPSTNSYRVTLEFSVWVHRQE